MDRMPVRLRSVTPAVGSAGMADGGSGHADTTNSGPTSLYKSSSPCSARSSGDAALARIYAAQLITSFPASAQHRQWHMLTGNITGNFANSGPQQRFSHLINELIQRLAAKFPTQRNREFLQP